MEATVTRWLKTSGDYVEASQPLVEVSTDKADVEIPAPASGYIQKVIVATDEIALVGSILGMIEAVSRRVESVAEKTEPVSPMTGNYYLLAPKWVEEALEPTVSRWLKSQGESLALGESILEITTQYGDIQVPSPVSGVLRNILIVAECAIEPGGALAVIEITSSDRHT